MSLKFEKTSNMLPNPTEVFLICTLLKSAVKFKTLKQPKEKMLSFPLRVLFSIITSEISNIKVCAADVPTDIAFSDIKDA